MRRSRSWIPIDREMLYRRYFREETQAELGRRFGISQMQVSRRLSRILVRLQRRLLAEEDQARPQARATAARTSAAETRQQGRVRCGRERCRPARRRTFGQHHVRARRRAPQPHRSRAEQHHRRPASRRRQDAPHRCPPRPPAGPRRWQATNSASRKAAGQNAGSSASPASRATSRARGRSAALPVKTILCPSTASCRATSAKRSRGPQPAAVGRAHVHHRGTRSRGWPRLAGCSRKSSASASMPCHCSSRVQRSARECPPVQAGPACRRSGGPDHVPAATAASRALAFRPAAVEVHRDVHLPGLDGNRNVQARGGQQFVAAHQVQRPPAARPVPRKGGGGPGRRAAAHGAPAPQRADRPASVPAGPAGGLSGRAARCFHCLASSAAGALAGRLSRSLAGRRGGWLFSSGPDGERRGYGRQRFAAAQGCAVRPGRNAGGGCALQR